MKLDLHPDFPSTVLLAPRVRPGVGELGEDPATPDRSDPSQIEMVLVGVVKASYAADDPAAAPLPDPAPLLERDVPFNPLANPDFAEPAVDDEGVITDAAPGWQAAGPALGWLDHSTGHPNVLVVTGAGEVTQTVEFDRPLGGRSFTLDLVAGLAAGAADAAAVVQLQVRSPSGVELFAGGMAVNLARNVLGRTPASAAWPGGLADTSATVVLRGLSAANPVWYDQVLLHEGRGLTWRFNEVVRHEHDMAVFKPRADVVVLGAPREPAGRPSPATLVGGTWAETVELGAASAAKTFSPGDDDTTWPFTFGWQTRLSGRRGRQPAKANPFGHAGWYGEPGPIRFDPAQLLPIGFHNRYHNGGEYAGGAPPFSHPAPGATVTVTSEAEYQPPAGPSLVVTETHVLHLPATAPELRVTYLDHCDEPVQETMPLAADTVVYDRDLGTFSVTWRGVWPFAAHPPDRYVAAALRGGG